MVKFEAGKAAEMAAQLGLWQGLTSVNFVSESDVQRFVLPLLNQVVALAEQHELYSVRTVREHIDALSSGVRDEGLFIGHLFPLTLR